MCCDPPAAGSASGCWPRCSPWGPTTGRPRCGPASPTRRRPAWSWPRWTPPGSGCGPGRPLCPGGRHRRGGRPARLPPGGGDPVAVEAGEVELVTRAGAWFPDGCLPKWDFHDRPYFHGNHLELDVPAVPLTVTCARGLEFATAQATITPEAGATAEVALEPARLHEPAARGWYGGDLHVHMNYSGDLVCGPDDVEGTAVLYHHLLSCGLRLAATVGTDVWLSFSRGPLFSNPPGWGRVYADLRGAPRSRPTGRCGCARSPAAPATRRSWGRWCSPTPARSGSRSAASRSAARPAPAGCWTAGPLPGPGRRARPVRRRRPAGRARGRDRPGPPLVRRHLLGCPNSASGSLEGRAC
jgi:hypothetical protein